jgi:hypothetical protein
MEVQNIGSKEKAKSNEERNWIFLKYLFLIWGNLNFSQ